MANAERVTLACKKVDFSWLLRYVIYKSMDIHKLRRIKKVVRTCNITASSLFFLFSLAFRPDLFIIGAYGLIISIFFL